MTERDEWNECSICKKKKDGYYIVDKKPVCHKCFILGKMMGGRMVEDT